MEERKHHEVLPLFPTLAIVTILISSTTITTTLKPVEAVGNAFVSLHNQDSVPVTGISAEIQTPSSPAPPGTSISYWVGLEYGSDPNNMQFIQVGLANPDISGNYKVFWAAGGPYENSGNPILCYFTGQAHNCPGIVPTDAVHLTPGDRHTYSIQYSQSGKWQLSVDGKVIHESDAHGYGTTRRPYFALETQWVPPWRYVNQGETIQAPTVSVRNILLTFPDGQKQPLLLQEFAYAAFDPSNNVNGMKVFCPSLSATVGAGLSHEKYVSCYVQPPIPPLPTPTTIFDLLIANFLLIWVIIVVLSSSWAVVEVIRRAK